MQIETERLILKSTEVDLLPLVFDYFQRNRKHFLPWGPAYEPAWDTEDYHRKKLLQYGQQMEAGNNFWVFLFEKDNEQKIIGDIHLSNIVRSIFQSCNIGYRLDETAQNHGFMREALTKVAQYTFQEMKLHRIEANIMPSNTRSIKLITSLGFEHEGLAKKHLKINGKWEDHIHYVLLNPEE
jgi:[ribosomal protein S5]-alanine N-acetyltransferase